MNKKTTIKISLKYILILVIILLMCLNIFLIAINLNNNSNIEKRKTSKEQLTTTSEYIDMETHLSEINNAYQNGYNDGEATGSVDAFNYHFRVTIPCYFEFSIPEDGWTRSNTASFYVDYKGGTLTHTSLNTPTTATYGSSNTGLQIADVNVNIIEKDKFTVTFVVQQTLKASWTELKTVNVIVKYDHGTATYTFDTTNWSSGSYDMVMKKNGDATVTIY